MTMDQIIAALKRHALDNYEKGGWDVIVECWSDEEIRAQLEKDGVTTLEGALKSFKDQIDVWSAIVVLGGSPIPPDTHMSQDEHDIKAEQDRRDAEGRLRDWIEPCAPDANVAEFLDFLTPEQIAQLAHDFRS
jgi:hypothetical protein